MPGALDFRWDPLQLAADNTFSTTIRIEISNWWEVGAPKKVSISVRQEGEDLLPGHEVLVQKGRAVHPLTGLEPRHHYRVVVSGEGRSVENVIFVPELPKPKTPEQELLETEKIQLERARTYFERKKLAVQEKKLTPDEKNTAKLKAKTELVKAGRELEEAKQKEVSKPKKPTRDEKKIDALKAKTNLIEAEKGLRQAEQDLKKTEPPESKRQIKVLHPYRRLTRLEVVLQRIGKDGRPEDGEISVLDFEQAGIVFGDATGDFPVQIKNWGMVVVFLSYFDDPRTVTFFLPDDTDVKVTVDVPARVVKEEKKTITPKSSLWAMMKEAYREERNKGKTSAFEFKIQRRQPVIFPSDLLLQDSSQGEGGQNG